LGGSRISGRKFGAVYESLNFIWLKFMDCPLDQIAGEEPEGLPRIPTFFLSYFYAMPRGVTAQCDAKQRCNGIHAFAECGPINGIFSANQTRVGNLSAGPPLYSGPELEGMESARTGSSHFAWRTGPRVFRPSSWPLSPPPPMTGRELQRWKNRMKNSFRRGALYFIGRQVSWGTASRLNHRAAFPSRRRDVLICRAWSLIGSDAGTPGTVRSEATGGRGKNRVGFSRNRTRGPLRRFCGR